MFKNKYTAVLCFLTVLAIIALTAMVRFLPEKHEKRSSVRVGFLLDGDMATPYTVNFLDVIDEAETVYGDSFEPVIRYNVKEDDVENPLKELIAEKCDLIFGCSYGYEYVMKEYAADYPDIQFCMATGDLANKEPVLENYHDFMGEIYQGRYTVGVITGMKIKEMIDEGLITANEAKVGYVGAFPYAEVISGYTAFILGIRSVVPEATLTVKYANTWNDYTVEREIATELIEDGCIIISQHSDTIGPAMACENAEKDIPIYHVGYNDSMTEVAPTSSIISCKVNYAPYILTAIDAVLSNERIEDMQDATIHQNNDTSAGFDKGWVRILDINEVIAPKGSQEKIESIISDFKAGKLQVFKGDYTGTDPFDPTDTIDLSDGFNENGSQSAPAFHYILDDVVTIKE